MDYSNVEIVRAALSACSFDSVTGARPVHTSRLNSFASGYGLDGDAVREELELLQLTRQVQALGGGHWIPAPTRLVDLGPLKLLLSAQPSETLAKLDPNISSGLGYGRLVSQAMDLPEEPLSSWLDAPDTSQWTAALLRQAVAEADTFVGPQEIELLGQATGRWAPVEAPKALPADEEWRVARYGKPRQYVLITCTAAGTREFRCTADDARRAAYGLRRMRGEPVNLTIQKGPRPRVRVDGPALPAAERRLVVSLAKSVPNSWQTYEFETMVVPIAAEHFTRLGVSITEQ